MWVVECHWNIHCMWKKCHWNSHCLWKKVPLEQSLPVEKSATRTVTTCGKKCHWNSHCLLKKVSQEQSLTVEKSATGIVTACGKMCDWNSHCLWYKSATRTVIACEKILVHTRNTFMPGINLLDHTRPETSAKKHAILTLLKICAHSNTFQWND